MRGHSKFLSARNTKLANLTAHPLTVPDSHRKPGNPAAETIHHKTTTDDWHSPLPNILLLHVVRRKWSVSVFWEANHLQGETNRRPDPQSCLLVCQCWFREWVRSGEAVSVRCGPVWAGASSAGLVRDHDLIYKRVQKISLFRLITAGSLLPLCGWVSL